MAKYVIQETNAGFRVGNELFKSLKEAIAYTDGWYVFIPYGR